MAPRLTKNQRRITTILRRIPAAREQLLAAMEEFSPEFALDRLVAAAESPDARERNKVAVIERELDVLVNWLEELAARGLDEGIRIGTVPSAPGLPWPRLADLRVISAAAAARLREIKDTRNDLGHAYPPQSWRAVHDAANMTLRELDGYLSRYGDWATRTGILPPPD